MKYQQSGCERRLLVPCCCESQCVRVASSTWSRPERVVVGWTQGSGLSCRNQCGPTCWAEPTFYNDSSAPPAAAPALPRSVSCHPHTPTLLVNNHPLQCYLIHTCIQAPLPQTRPSRENFLWKQLSLIESFLFKHVNVSIGISQGLAWHYPLSFLQHTLAPKAKWASKGLFQSTSRQKAYLEIVLQPHVKAMIKSSSSELLKELNIW